MKDAKLEDGTRWASGQSQAPLLIVHKEAAYKALYDTRGPMQKFSGVSGVGVPPLHTLWKTHTLWKKRVQCPTPPCRVEDAVVGVAGSVRENIRLRRAFLVAATGAPSQGLVGSYIHTSPAPGLGRIAGLVALESDKPLAGEAAAAVQVRRRRRVGRGGGC